jgi:hypothetical protein
MKDFKYVNNKNSCMSVNETAMQNIWRHHFLQPGTLSEVGEIVAHIWQQVVGIAALYKFLQIMRDSYQPLPMAHIWLTLLDILILLTLNNK